MYGIDLKNALAQVAGGASDLYSISKIAKFLLVGETSLSSADMAEDISEEMKDLLEKIESENPLERTSAVRVLDAPLFGMINQLELDEGA